jgi:hypothetical protein
LGIAKPALVERGTIRENERPTLGEPTDEGVRNVRLARRANDPIVAIVPIMPAG